MTTGTFIFNQPHPKSFSFDVAGFCVVYIIIAFTIYFHLRWPTQPPSNGTPVVSRVFFYGLISSCIELSIKLSNMISKPSGRSNKSSKNKKSSKNNKCIKNNKSNKSSISSRRYHDLRRRSLSMHACPSKKRL